MVKDDIVKITSDEVKALKKADNLVFHYRGGQHYIRAIKIDKDVFGEISREVRIKCQGKISVYGRRKYDLGDIEECSHIVTNVQTDLALRTALSFIKKGDILILRWVSNNNNQCLDNASLFQDQLYLQVHRGDLHKNVAEFLIGTTITPNNSAKMCKHTSTPYIRY